MDHDQLRSEIRRLIARNRTEEAFKLLSKVHFTKADKALIVLNSQYNRIKEEQRLNIISADEAERRINKINLALLDLSLNVSSKSSASSPLIGSTTSLASSSFKWLWLLLIPVLGLAIYFGFSGYTKTDATLDNETTEIAEPDNPDQNNPGTFPNDINEPPVIGGDSPQVGDQRIVTVPDKRDEDSNEEESGPPKQNGVQKVDLSPSSPTTEPPTSIEDTPKPIDPPIAAPSDPDPDLNHYEFRLTGMKQLNLGDDDNTDEIEVFGRISLMAIAPLATLGEGESSSLFNKSSSQYVVMTKTVPYYPMDVKRNIYVKKEFLSSPITVLCFLEEHDDFDNDEITGTITLKPDQIQVGSPKKKSFYIDGEKGVRIQLDYEIKRIH